MSDYWFTADQHFNHPAIIKHCYRPFTTVDQMNDALIEAWNANVRKADVVVVLGDFYWASKMDAVLKFADNLNGTKIFVKGNHDRWFTRDKRYMYNKKIAGIRVWGCHYPLASWPSGVNLHGHCHGTYPPHVNRLDVGVDTNTEYRPYNIDEIKQMIDYRLLSRQERYKDLNV